MVRSYGKVLALGHKFLDGLFAGMVAIQEKIDGSQFSFGKYDGVLRCRSNGCQIDMDNVPKLFQPAVKAVIARQYGLVPEHTYRGETLYKPKHNVLKYNRIPKDNIILFDVMRQKDQDYLTPKQVEFVGTALQLEVVPTYYYGEYCEQSFDRPLMTYLQALLGKESCLGGIKIEGVVIKNYSKIGPDGKILRGKYVSSKFKEKHDGVSEQSKDKYIVNQIILTHHTEARFSKTVQKLKEKGEWTQTPKDIGAMMKILNEDIESECEAEIKDMLYKHFRKNIIRGITRGFAEFYKEQLALWSVGNGMGS